MKILSLLALATLLALPAFAADLADVKASKWDMRMLDSSGSIILFKGMVIIDDTKGTMIGEDGTKGTLKGIRYSYLPPDSGTITAIGVYGSWEFDGRGGGFTLKVAPDAQSIKGTQRDGKELPGEWKGTRINPED